MERYGFFIPNLKNSFDIKDIVHLMFFFKMVPMMVSIVVFMAFDFRSGVVEDNSTLRNRLRWGNGQEFEKTHE